MMNIYEISEKIAQRPPFQMIEKVTELVPNESAVGIKLRSALLACNRKASRRSRKESLCAPEN